MTHRDYPESGILQDRRPQLQFEADAAPPVQEISQNQCLVTGQPDYDLIRSCMFDLHGDHHAATHGWEPAWDPPGRTVLRGIWTSLDRRPDIAPASESVWTA